MGRYITASEVKNWRPPQSSSLPDWSGWTDEQLEDMIIELESILEESTSNIWYVKTNVTIIMDGNGREKLMPAHRGYHLPIVQVHSVENVDFDGTIKDTYVYGKEFVFDSHEPYSVIWNRCQSNSIRSSSYGSFGWPKGQRNIRLLLDMGTDGMPEELKKALIRWTTAEALGPEYAGMTSVTGEGGKVQEVWEDYTVTYGRSTATESRRNKNVSNISGYLPIDRVLSKYINFAGMFKTV